MNKKIAIGVIIILLAITAIVYVGIWNAKKEKAAVPASQVPTASTNQPAKDADGKTTGETARPADSDVSAIEADLNSVTDDSFSENTLSDTEVGL